MGTSLRAPIRALGVLLALSIAPQSLQAQRHRTTPEDRGAELFAKVWTSQPESDKHGNGLGPLFNDRSCAACHFQGGVGGAGPITKNVELLSAVVPESREKLIGFPERLVELHPGFREGTTIVLHQSSTDADAYQDFRDALLGIRRGPQLVSVGWGQSAIVRQEEQRPVSSVVRAGITLLLSARNTTALFGAGLIQSIPQDAIERAAEQQAKESPGVQGRFAGRFGWRGQQDDLEMFVRGACAGELGLRVSTDDEAIDPLPRLRKEPEVKHDKELDLTDQQCDDLTAFIASLPAPKRTKPGNTQQAASINNGEALFNSVGCAACHRPKLGDVEGIYSDLLVHNMGPGLADPAPASSARTFVHSYFGGRPLEPLKPEDVVRTREWKTPPLWGLRDSAPYLHDGRAVTVEQAIAFHGGEAANSVERFANLNPPERMRILQFLATLAAP